MFTTFSETLNLILQCFGPFQGTLIDMGYLHNISLMWYHESSLGHYKQCHYHVICILFQHWKDRYLVWNPGDYGDIDAIRLSHSLIWIPDITLYNT